MKIKNLLCMLLVGGICSSLSSCIKDEAQNSEADIIECTPVNFTLLKSPVITNNSITLYANDDINISKVALNFTTTPGASIEPENGTVLDFTQPQVFTVYSKNKKWSKKYTVSFIGGKTTISTKFDFEDARTVSQETAEANYQVFYSKRSDESDMEWGSGNIGFCLTNSTAKADEYPTFQSEHGYKGKCLQLVTRSTGELGAMFGCPIAAGNLFIGSFDTDNIMETTKATLFGVPFKYIPNGLTGYYKYKPGDVYTNEKNEEVKGKQDTFDIYAVFYESKDGAEYLDGTNSLTSPDIVMIARLEERKVTDNWTFFSVPFKTLPGKSVDNSKLEAGKYNVSIIMSSSIDGGLFNGAVGSTLCVDEMELLYDTKNESIHKD